MNSTVRKSQSYDLVKYFFNMFAIQVSVTILEKYLVYSSFLDWQKAKFFSYDLVVLDMVKSE